jgi:HD-GYP domain-containing protein (c-di-GMP phosphodiesterase class II)
MRYLFLILLLASCSVQNLISRAERKGYRCDTITDTIRVVKVDSFLVVKHDTTYWEKIITSKDTIIRYKTSYIPKTRFETRFEYKRFNDSLKVIRLMYKDSLRNALKTRENDLKKERISVKHSTLNQFKQLFIISGFILTLIFLFLLFRKVLN